MNWKEARNKRIEASEALQRVEQEQQRTEEVRARAMDALKASVRALDDSGKVQKQAVQALLDSNNAAQKAYNARVSASVAAESSKRALDYVRASDVLHQNVKRILLRMIDRSGADAGEISDVCSQLEGTPDYGTGYCHFDDGGPDYRPLRLRGSSPSGE